MVVIATKQERMKESEMDCGHEPGYCTDACDGAYAGEISAAEWERDHG